MALIIIADSHRIYREALCDYLRSAEPGFTIHAAPDADEASRLYDADPADLIILDESLCDGFEDRQAGARIGVLCSAPADTSTREDRGHVVFYKSSTAKSILAGMRQLLSGETAVAPEPTFDCEHRPRWPKGQDFSLTMREREVLSHLMRGESNKEIARALRLQVVTVKLHVRGICRKMKVANRTQAALLAIENELGG